jgi:polycystin 2
LLGVNAVVTWLKTLKYLNEFPHLSMLSITMSNAYYPTVSFLIMFFIIFAGCGQAFNMAFGPYMKSYNNFTTSMMSLFRALLGEFEYEEMQQTDRLVGPLLFITFMLLVLFVLVNMFIAILSEAYEKAKIEVFGDSFASRDERWKDAVTFIEYIGGSASHVCTGVSKVCKKAVGMSGTQVSTA